MLFQIQRSSDNKIEISSSKSDEDNLSLPTSLTTKQLRAIAKKYYKLENNEQTLRVSNVDVHTEEKDEPNKINKENKNTTGEIDKNINIKKEVNKNYVEDKQLQEGVSTKTNENKVMKKETSIKDANAQQLLQFWSSDDVIIHTICTI